MNYSGLFYDDVLNGEGVRVALFLSGCSHNCPGCYNQDALDPRYGQEFTPELLEEILTYMEKPYVKGITLSGGDPLFGGNLEGVWHIIDEVRTRFGYSKDIWLWTGYTKEEVYEGVDNRQMLLRRQILDEVDTYIEGRFVEEKKDLTLKWRGSSNQRVFSRDSGELIQLYKESEL